MMDENWWKSAFISNFLPISCIVDDYCGLRCPNFSQKPNNWQLVTSFVSLDLENEVQVQTFSIVSSQSTKIDQNVNFWPVLANSNL